MSGNYIAFTRGRPNYIYIYFFLHVAMAIFFWSIEGARGEWPNDPPINKPLVSLHMVYVYIAITSNGGLRVAVVSNLQTPTAHSYICILFINFVDEQVITLVQCCVWLVTMALHVHYGLGQLSPLPTSGDDK